LIKRLAIENFKSIRSLELECRRVNVFIGEPNTGKSNILEALGLLSLMAYRENPSLFVRMKRPQELFHNYNIREPIRIAVDEDEVVGKHDIENDVARFYVKGQVEALLVIGADGVSFVGLTPDFVKRLMFYRFTPDTTFRRKHQAFLLPPDGHNLPSVLAFNSSLRSMISEILQDYGYRLMIDLHRATLEIAWELGDVLWRLPYELLSDTLRRLIFHLAAIESNEGAVITMEEPEAHAFPAYTKYLAERVALDDRNQYFITTHNPYFLLSLVEKTPVKELAVYVTYLRGYETRAKLLSEDELEELLDLASAVFFNLDRFLKGLLGVPED